MKRSLVTLLSSLLMLGAATFASEQNGVTVIDAQMKIIRNPDASWDAKWDAYNAMKEVKDSSEAAQTTYAAYQKEIAEAIRRDNVPASGWVMGLFGAALLWGGLAYCMGVARKSGKGMGAEE